MKCEDQFFQDVNSNKLYSLRLRNKRFIDIQFLDMIILTSKPTGTYLITCLQHVWWPYIMYVTIFRLNCIVRRYSRLYTASNVDNYSSSTARYKLIIVLISFYSLNHRRILITVLFTPINIHGLV